MYYIQVQSNGQSSDFTSQAAAGSGLSAPVFNYGVLVPIITSVTPQTPVAPGNPITINGFNFVTGVTVGFCQQTNTAPYYTPTACLVAGTSEGR